jgi:hypothetical protein
MLLTMLPMEEIYHKSCALTEDATDVREAFQHPTRLVQFLVGMKGKSEPMAIGGPWSPTLDGANPGEDPRVLINTAIRTTRSLTGIDLSRCTQWWVSDDCLLWGYYDVTSVLYKDNPWFWNTLILRYQF